MRFTSFVVLILSFFLNISADNTDLYPLSIGNIWRYEFRNIDEVNEIKIIDSFEHKKTYYYIREITCYVCDVITTYDTVCAKESGKIYKRSGNKDVLQYDFSINYNDSVQVPDNSWGSIWQIKEVAPFNDVAVGTFDTICYIRFDNADVRDEARHEYFVRGIGLVQWQCEWDILNRDLTYAKIDNEEISVADIVTRPLHFAPAIKKIEKVISLNKMPYRSRSSLTLSLFLSSASMRSSSRFGKEM